MINDTVPSRSLEVIVLESLIGIIFTISAVAGNFLVLVAVYRNPQLRKVSNVYILCLSLTDFFMGVFVFPIVDATLITGKYPGGMNLCWFQGILCFLLGIVSILTMAMIAVQRYYKIVKRNEHKNIFSPRFVILSIALTWSAAILVMVLFALTGRGVHFYEQFPICLVIIDKIALFVAFYLFGLLLPFFTMSLLYFKIWRFIKSHNAQVNQSNVNAEGVKLTKSLCVVVGAFVACYTPFAVATGLVVTYEVRFPRQIHFFVSCAVAFASVVNPIIYGVTNREFRKEFAKIVCYHGDLEWLQEWTLHRN